MEALSLLSGYVFIINCFYRYTFFLLHTIIIMQEVCFQDAHGFTSVGYMRVSRVLRKPAREEENESDNGDDTTNGQQAKKIKKESDSDLSVQATGKTDAKPDSALAGALALQSLQKSSSSDEGGDHPSSSSATGKTSSKATTSKSSGKYTNGSTGSDANTSEDSSKPRAGNEEDESEEEYVCVIRPADVSVPPGSSVCFQTYLSTASMVEHDRKREDTDVNHTEKARGSPSCSVSGSNDSGSNHSGSDDKQSNNKVSTTTGTSSETGSEEGYSA